MPSQRVILILIGVVAGAGALATWVILGLAGDARGGGLPLAIVASVFTAIGFGAFLLDRQLSKRRSSGTDSSAGHGGSMQEP
jgi:hypothetical protein